MAQRIALIGGGHSGNDAAILRGIHRYARPARPWILHDATRAADDLLALRQILSYKPDGLIACAATGPLIDALKATGLPVVNTSAAVKEVDLPTVRFDDRAVGALAGDYLIERGFRHFGFIADPGTGFSDARELGLRDRLAAADCDLNIFAREAWSLPWLPGADDYKRMSGWIAALPRPAALVAVHDQIGSVAAQICGELGIAVPEQVAVLGIDNYELICEMAHPPLSSVALPAERLGREAAALLERMLAGEATPPPPPPLPPMDVVTRQSTDIHAVDDPHLARAMRYIRTHACAPCTVSDVLREVPVNRRWLERRFREMIDRSPHDQIIRHRMAQARALLGRTDQAVPRIAEQVGYRNVQNFQRTFRERVGLTPTEYRRQFRAS